MPKIKKPLISVIIPVYNVEKYISECLESILNQTYKNIEIICVNDGSTDNSLEIIKQFKKNGVKVYTQKNHGLGITRNNGMKHASGQYIMFIDSDDYLASNCIENYVQPLNNEDYDIVAGGYQKIKDGKIIFVRKLNTGDFAKYVIPTATMKLYKRIFIDKNNLSFPKTSGSEDIYFNLEAYGKKPRIKIIDDTGYYYRFNPVSIANTRHKSFDNTDNVLNLIKTAKKTEYENPTLRDFFIMRYIVWHLLHCGKMATKKNFIKEYSCFFNWLEKNIPNYQKNYYLYHFPKGENKSIYRIVVLFFLLHKMNLIPIFARLYCRG